MSADTITYIVEQDDGSFKGYLIMLSTMEEKVGSGEILMTFQEYLSSLSPIFTALDMRSAVLEYERIIQWPLSSEYGYRFMLKEGNNG